MTAPILLIDGMNLFARHYIRNPAMSTHGHHAGGIVGFLSSLKMLAEFTSPCEIYICWEGGGSARRRAIFPDYKKNRKPPKLNRYYEDEIPDSAENRIYQIKSLVEILNHVPVCQIYVEDCEGDDVIGYLSRNRFKDRKKIIASADKDFYQLLDDNTLIYSWTKNEFVGPENVPQEFGTSAKNFIVAKVICGDPSDNIPGVQGVGFKSLVRRFPALTSDVELTTSDIIKEAQKHASGKLKIMKNISESTDLINRNWRLMYLDVSNLAAVQVRKIDAIVDGFKPKKQKLKLMRRLLQEGLPTFDVHEFWSAFQAL